LYVNFIKMAKLSVNINKIATIRNARGGNVPNVLQAALNCEKFGAEGITVHPRPDQRHITYKDVADLHQNITTELNIEGYPSEDFIDLVLNNTPHQVTLVPDPPDAITSNAGWDVIKNYDFLKDVCATFKNKGIRVSIFMETDLKQIEKAATVGCDRIELYTEYYAVNYLNNPEKAIEKYVVAGKLAKQLNLGLNAGHDLNLDNLAYFAKNMEGLDEVSIGHALISDALYLGLQKTIELYKTALK
jgi:pyridoxine 5-phosphate synthase